MNGSPFTGTSRKSTLMFGSVTSIVVPQDRQISASCFTGAPVPVCLILAAVRRSFSAESMPNLSKFRLKQQQQTSLEDRTMTTPGPWKVHTRNKLHGEYVVYSGDSFS